MIMKVLLFAGLKDSIKSESVDVEVLNQTVGRIKQSLIKKYPACAGLIERSHIAVDQNYVNDDFCFEIEPKEIAIIPPVSGG